MIISPSLLAANFACLDIEIKRIEDTKATWLHYDVMDGHFVPNISFGYSILKDIRKITPLFLDVHLMISDPRKYVDEFINAGADLIVFHYEAMNNLFECEELVNYIHEKNIKAGISIKPQTDVEAIEPLLAKLDLVLVMSVEPGFGGQKFDPSAVNKITYLRNRIDALELNCLIEVDGGINAETGKLCKDAGVDVLVAGSYIFGNEDAIIAVNSLL